MNKKNKPIVAKASDINAGFEFAEKFLKMELKQSNGCQACDSLEISLKISQEKQLKFSKDNFLLENENLILNDLTNELSQALLELLNDYKSEHGIDEFVIFDDSSSFGKAQKVLKKFKHIKGGVK